mgnify:CR=1 FL=1
MAERALVIGARTRGARERNFVVTTTDEHGKRNSQAMRATGRSRLRMELKARGERDIEIVETRPWWSLQFGSRIPARVLLDTTRQLAAFSEAGISVLEALTMIGESTRNKRMRAVLQMMADDIRDGETLPQTVRAHGGAFPPYYMAMIDAADRTGNLATTFGTLANYLERDTASRRAVKSALFYPAILVALGSVAVVVLSVVVLPRFAEFFDGLDVPLPTPTRMLLAGTAFVANWWSWLFGAIAASVILLVLTGRTSSGRQVLDRWKLRIPIAGPLLRDIALERFSRVLGNLSGAGVTLVDALELSSTVVANQHYARAVNATREGVIRGRGLAEPMTEAQAFPPEVVQVIRVGEHTGRLTEQLQHAAQFYAREVDYRLKTLTSMLEPVALLLVGGAVGFVAVALVSAMYGIYSDAGLGQ